MGSLYKLSALTIACSLVLAGCGSGSSSDSNTGAAGITDLPIDNSVASNGIFFSDDGGVDYASGLGGDLMSVVDRAVGSSNSALSTAAVEDDPSTGLFNDSTSVEQCDSGSISTSVASNTNNDLESASIVFNNCVIDGQTSSGSMSISASSSGNIQVLNIDFADFGSTGSEGDSYIDGGIAMSIGDDLSTSISGSQLALTADGETTVFSNYSLNASNDDTSGDISMGGGATISSSTDGTLSIAINPAFSGPADGNPIVGVLQMLHADGSSLIVDADTGNPDTYTYIVNGNGAVSSGIGNWDDEGFVVPAFADGNLGN